MSDFFTKIERKSVDPIEWGDLERMKNYQLALVDEMIYHQKAKSLTSQQRKVDGMLAEITRLDKWLKNSFADFTNDNKRKLFA